MIHGTPSLLPDRLCLIIEIWPFARGNACHTVSSPVYATAPRLRDRAPQLTIYLDGTRMVHPPH